MREIKFRAWDKSAGQMLNNVHNTYDWELMPVDKSEDESFHLMQFTGLRDKNGVEIYESDVVMFGVRQGDRKNETKRTGVIGAVSIHPFGTGFGSFDAAWCANVTVIGNIHENPEMLK